MAAIQGQNQLTPGQNGAYGAPYQSTTAGPFTNNFQAQPFVPNNGSFTNPYFNDGQQQAGSNAQLNATLAAGQGIQGAGLNTTAGGVGGEQTLANYESGIATGATPTVASSELAQTTSQNIGNEMALSAQARGGNPALSAYNGAAAAGNLNQQAAGQEATAALQEREGAAGVAGGLESNIAGQGLSEAQLGTQQGEFATGTSTAEQNALMQAQENEQQIAANQSLGTEQINAGIAGQNAQNVTNLIGGVAGGVGAAFGFAQGGQVPYSMGSSNGGTGGPGHYLAQGGVVPGPDGGVDDRIVALRGGEIVIPPEDPSFAAIRAHMLSRNPTTSSSSPRAQRIVSRIQR